MLQSQLFFKTRKEVPADADSINASYLIRAGFADKLMSGVYALLPLGFRVLSKIENIVREEMNAVGSQEVLMNILQPKEIWDETGRWESAVDIFYKFKDTRGADLALAPTHEEQAIDIVRNKAKSYKDLPLSIFQINTKFRNEARAKSGLLRGREFRMKDMYSFHESEEDLNNYYDNIKKVYSKVFSRLGLDAKLVAASGGIFSKYSHEFQVLTEIGEDTIFYCDNCDYAVNKEITEVKEGDKCPECNGKIQSGRGIEVGNIFPLKTKWSAPMNAKFVGKDGKEQIFIMGCYGIGLTRSLATIVEVYYDSTKNKMVWPKEVSPFGVHLISLGKNDEAEKIYNDLIEKGIDVLYDDRETSAGEKFAEADLLGAPYRIVVSAKTLASNSVEFSGSNDDTSRLVPLDKIGAELRK